VGYEGIGGEEAVVVGDNAAVCVNGALKAATTARRGEKNVLEGLRIVVVGAGFRQCFWRWGRY